MKKIQPPKGLKSVFVFKTFEVGGGHSCAPDYRPLLKLDGSWNKCHDDGPLELCMNGIHGFKNLAAIYWFDLIIYGGTLHLFELKETTTHRGTKKVAGRYGRSVMQFDLSSDEARAAMFDAKRLHPILVKQFKNKFPKGKVRKS